MTLRFLLVVTLASLVNSCSACSPVAAVTPPAPAPTPEVAPALPLGDKLAYEASHRPHLAADADSFFAVLEDAGVAFSRRFQSVASVYNARYCTNGQGPHEVTFTVCEFDRADVVSESARLARIAFKTVPNLEVHTSGQRMLLMRGPTEAEPTRVKALALHHLNAP